MRLSRFQKGPVIAVLLALLAAALLLRLTAAQQAGQNIDTRFAAPPPAPDAVPAPTNPEKLNHLPGKAGL